MLVDSPFGILLKRHRAEAGLTQEELADRSGVPARTISDLERSVNRTGRLDTVQRLASALSLSGQKRRAFEAVGRGGQDRPATAAEWAVVGAPLGRTTLVGRDLDVTQILDLIKTSRVLTLCGPPGVGKTRLALTVAAAAASSYRDAPKVVSFSGLQDPQMFLVHLAAKLDVTAPSGEDPALAMARALSGRKMLLVLDNLEHLLAAMPSVDFLLSECPELTLLTTSRHSLGLTEEVVWQVTPLPVPAPGVRSLDELRAAPSVALFSERAMFSDPGFALGAANAPVVAEICRRLEGLPLAIELAASRVGLLTVTTIRNRLEHRLRFLPAGQDALDRTWTLRECIAWSYDLLTADDRRLLRALAAFPGGAVIPAVAEVAGIDEVGILDGLEVLVRHSLAWPDTDPDGESRLRMMEAIREYGLERLTDAGESAAVSAALTRYYVRLADLAEVQLSGGEQREWLDRLEQEHDNLRDALGRAVRDHDPAGVHLAGALWRFWLSRRHHAEGMRWLEESLADGPPVTAGESLLTEEERVALVLRARALNGAGALSYMQGDTLLARSRYEEAVQAWRRLGDEASAVGPLVNFAMAFHFGDDTDEADRLYGQALQLARTAGDDRAVANVLMNRGTLATSLGKREQAIGMLEEAASLFRRLRDQQSEAAALGAVAAAQAERGYYQQARVLSAHVLGVFEQAGNGMGAQEALITLGRIDAAEGDTGTAVRRFKEALTISEEDSDPWGVASAHTELARMALYYHDADLEQARRHAEEALRLCVQVKYAAGTATAIGVLAGLDVAAEDYERALAHCAEGLAAGGPAKDQASLVVLLELAAVAAAHLGRPEPAGMLLGIAAGLCPPARPRAETRFADEARAKITAELGGERLLELVRRGRELRLDGIPVVMAGLNPP
ncbi:MAG TPA: tetratricopeptide repeat protein [Streptosporangiaceae bacterium]|nr:tetratricopeptide repeat protein [Streptosporangiaceae bacterium]